MPILASQPDIFPGNLLDDAFLHGQNERQWWVLSTQPRTEKKLITALAHGQIPHYCPLLPKRYRSPNGRFRTSYIPAFSNYVFLYGTEEDRYESLKSNYVVRNQKVTELDQFLVDLRRIYTAIQSGTPLQEEERLNKGDRAWIKTGKFKGFEGIVIRREGKTRLLLTVNFLEQGVSMEIDECLLQPL